LADTFVCVLDFALIKYENRRRRISGSGHTRSIDGEDWAIRVSLDDTGHV